MFHQMDEFMVLQGLSPLSVGMLHFHLQRQFRPGTWFVNGSAEASSGYKKFRSGAELPHHRCPAYQLCSG